jgi:hypothetical protein
MYHMPTAATSNAGTRGHAVDERRAPAARKARQVQNHRLFPLAQAIGDATHLLVPRLATSHEGR